MEFSLQKVILKIFVTCFLALPQLFWHTGHTANAEILKSTKPNIIFIMADDLGKVLLPMYGAKPTIKMPNLEQLAKE